MRKDTIATRKRIVNAAEKLFAEYGVDNTSLLDISKAAKQKNRSALQYHFKDKQGLLDAVLDKHAIGIALRRTSMLDQLEARGNFTLYQLIEALVLPVAALLDQKEDGHAFLKIHSQLMTSESYRELRTHRDQNAPDVLRLQKLMVKHTNSSTPKVVQTRLMLAGVMLIHGLASYLIQADRIPSSVFLHTLVQGIADLLQQPSP